jgi:hypothetical protein
LDLSMPPLLEVEGGLASWIVSRKEIMLSLAGLSLLLLTLLLGSVSANVVLVTSTNETLQFPDNEASFGELFFSLYSFGPGKIHYSVPSLEPASILF